MLRSEGGWRPKAGRRQTSWQWEGQRLKPRARGPGWKQAECRLRPKSPEAEDYILAVQGGQPLNPLSDKLLWLGKGAIAASGSWLVVLCHMTSQARRIMDHNENSCLELNFPLLEHHLQMCKEQCSQYLIDNGAWHTQIFIKPLCDSELLHQLFPNRPVNHIWV